MKKSRKTTVIFRINSNVKCQFKAWCAARNKTMTEVVEQMMVEKMRETK